MLIPVVYSEDLVQAGQIDSIANNIEGIVNKFVEDGLFSNDAGKKLIAKHNDLPIKTKNSLKKLLGWQIKERLSNYADSKRMFIGKVGNPLDNVNDFSWSYMSYDMEWALFTVVSADSVTVNNIASGPVVVVSDGLGLFFGAKKEETIVVPMIENSFSVQATGATGDTLWYVENIGKSKSVYFPLSYSEGVTLFINSDPVEADIYFNNKKYHKKTNTTCVRDPGKYTISIKKNAYKIWTKEYTFKKGGKYNLNVDLEPLN